MRQASPITTGLVVLTLAGALAVRAIEPGAVRAPDEPEEGPILQEPMQLLRRGGEERIGELDPLVGADLREDFVSTRLDLLELEGCPPLTDWLRSRRGLAFERTVGVLARADRAEALAALALVFQLARSTSWNPGFFGSSDAADRLGGILRGWIEDRGESAAGDASLYEPALAAVVAYGRVMHVASEGGLFGGSAASRERAVAFLREVAGAPGERRTDLGLALAARHPGALTALERDRSLAGFAREAELAFPGLDGECGR